MWFADASDSVASPVEALVVTQEEVVLKVRKTSLNVALQVAMHIHIFLMLYIYIVCCTIQDAAEEHGEAEMSAAVEPTSITSSLQAMDGMYRFNYI